MVPSPIPDAAAAASPFARPGPAEHPACPLLALAREAETLIRRQVACDARALAVPGAAERAAAEREMDRLGEALDGLAERAASLAAGSREGALFALVLAAGEAEILAVSDDAPDAADRARSLARLVRHLWSARGVLEREASLPPAITEFWMPRRLAPGRGPQARQPASAASTAAPSRSTISVTSARVTM